MEHINLSPQLVHRIPVEPEHKENTQRSFIEANTIVGSLEEIKHEHIIPVFANNEPLISHADFIETTSSIAADLFHGERILMPDIRVSHAIKGRVPEAKNKPIEQLMEWEKTLYYERMAFIIEIPSIQSIVDGNLLSLTIGGVKAYNMDSLYSRSANDQKFKIFIGFKNTVCTNLCVWTDGYMDDVKVKNVGQLKSAIHMLLESYNHHQHLNSLSRLVDYSITEQQFAHLVGRCRMYNHLPNAVKESISPILFGDQQMNMVVKDFYKDNSFCRDVKGNINLWKLYNLFTGTNKSSYIDSFLDRSVNAFAFIEQVRENLEGSSNSWYLN
jgi:hypothetical protein